MEYKHFCLAIILQSYFKKIFYKIHLITRQYLNLKKHPYSSLTERISKTRSKSKRNTRRSHIACSIFFYHSIISPKVDHHFHPVTNSVSFPSFLYILKYPFYNYDKISYLATPPCSSYVVLLCSEIIILFI